MKLRTLIEKLEKAESSYKKKHGVDPVIWGWYWGELELCAKKKTRSGTTQAVKPMMTFKIIFADNNCNE